jgi:hypothetical protein
MKQLSIIIVLFVACKSKPTGVEERKLAARETAQKVQNVIDQVKADCDSNVYRLASIKADSIKLQRKKLRRSK